LNTCPDLPNPKLYNKSGRGLPDVSAYGLNFEITVGGENTKVDGTSASAPLFASFITKINVERQKLGGKPLGFLNPALY